MAPRRKSYKNRDLPRNLYPNNRGASFKYRRPDGVFKSVGSDRKKAIGYALELNAYYYGIDKVVAAVVSASEKKHAHTVNEYLNDNLKAIMQERELATTTQKGWGEREPHIRDEFGEQDPRHISVSACVSFLKDYSPAQWNKYRSMCSVIWSYMVQDDWVGNNPWDVVRSKKERVTRMRLTAETYSKIWKAAGDLPEVGAAIQNAMDLALHTLQRRADVASLTRSQVKDGSIYVVQGKTGMALRIQMGPTLEAVVKRCKSDNVACPYLVHQSKDARKHRIAKRLSPSSISRGFTKARDKTKLFDDLKPGQTPPSFHEIRSLGAKLYEDAGVPQNEIQGLLGHTSAKQTGVYLSRHSIRYKDVFGGLEL